MLANQAFPRLALTPGEPAGIGPDLCIQLAQQDLSCQIIAIASPELLLQRAKKLNLDLQIHEFEPNLPSKRHEPGHLTVLPVSLAQSVEPGKLNSANSNYVLSTISHAVQGCLKGIFDAMVTGPVHKAIINEAGISFTGHTEYIAGITGGSPVMMLATPGLRVALASTHLALADVSAAITYDRLSALLKIIDHDLKSQFKISQPRILVCGLNPHAGENGHLGREEIDTIIPVLNNLKKRGLNVQGPLPADTVFTPKYLENADVVVAMYHDQGLPVLKHMGFGQAVNITLGLPIIRTSVDHGTALDLAGSGQAELGSLLYAIQTALIMTSKTTATIN
ncbi:MAG: 4-hydroxythreonine-4-phosphate dehydrogenase PdxA [Methylococcaceae bacterium]|jgi:4-hydroxythreonine-4-phosphate dehydrogenase